MVAELLRLNARLAINTLRASPWRAVRAILDAVLALAVLGALTVGAVLLADTDAAFTRRIVIIAGSLVSFGVFAVPVFAARAESLDRRALRGYGIRPLVLAAALVVVTFLGPALLLIAPLGFVPLVIWNDTPVAGVALLAAALLAVQHVLAWRLGRGLGTALSSRPQARLWVRLGVLAIAAFGAVVLALSALARAIPLLGDTGTPPALETLRLVGEWGLARADEVLAASPLGALWAAPAHAALGTPGAVELTFSVGVVTIILLAVMWTGVVRDAFRSTWPTRAVRKRGVPGWFRRVGSTPFAAGVARSLSYWLRDPRYRTVLAFVPIIPVVTLLAFWIGGVPFSLAVLLPLPLMLLVVGWATLHNDVAYDSTALWSLLAAQLDGRDDRLSRAVPVLAIGGAIALVGIPLTVWGHGDLAIAPALVGVSAALLLGAVGVSSVSSVRAPYPAPRPGDGAFQQPELGDSAGLDAQASSLGLTLLVALPAIALTVLGLAGLAGPWYWLALVAGVGAGAAVAVLGVRAGARDFDEAGPELLAFTMRN